MDLTSRFHLQRSNSTGSTIRPPFVTNVVRLGRPGWGGGPLYDIFDPWKKTLPLAIFKSIASINNLVCKLEIQILFCKVTNSNYRWKRMKNSFLEKKICRRSKAWVNLNKMNQYCWPSIMITMTHQNSKSREEFFFVSWSSWKITGEKEKNFRAH